MPWTKDRTCKECERVDVVRRDSKSEVCKSCASRRSGAKGLATLRARQVLAACAHCRGQFPAKPHANAGRGQIYCCIDCRRLGQSVERACLTCGKVFRVARSRTVPGSTTNSVGKFCSRPCYERHLCRTERTTGRGSQWNAVRREALKRAPFCGLCGTRKRLQVHHIIPFRLTRDNRQVNLMPLCVRCHKVVESIFVGVEAIQPDMREALKAWWVMLKERQDATRAKLLELWRGLSQGRTMADRSADRVREEPSQQ